jgi:deoxyribonuclease-4
MAFGPSVGLSSLGSKELDKCKCIQTTLGPMDRYKVESLTPYKKYLQTYLKERSFYVHCAYVANLSNVDKDKRDKSLINVIDTLKEVKDIPSSCVLHIGTRGKINHIVDNINYLENNSHLKNKSERHPYPLLLEVAAGKGTELGKDWDEIRLIYEGIDNCCVGLCLDTCHLFASGMSPLQDYEDVVKLFDNVNNITGHKANLIHLNDSAEKNKSCKDRHEVLGQGYIWYKNTNSLKDLMYRCMEDNIDVVSETGDYQKDAEVVRQLNLDTLF